MACAVLPFLQAASSVGFVLASGAAVGAVPAVVRDGPGSAALRGLVFRLIVVGALFVVQQALVPVLDYYANRFGRLVDNALRARLVAVSVAPTGIGHLEDPGIADRFRDAQGIGEGQYTPGRAIAGLFRNFGTWLTVLSQTVVVALFSWWLALVLTVFLVVVRHRLIGELVANANTARQDTEELRRADYDRELGLTPQAAKEIRVFGLAPWLLGRFRGHAAAGMAVVWRDRAARIARPWLWSVPWGVVTVLGLVLDAHAAIHGEISLGTMSVTAQAILVASSVWISQDDVQIAYGMTAVPVLLELERQLVAPRAAKPGDVPMVPLGDIRFECVRFRYPGQSDDVYTDLDLTIPAGRSVAIVGMNGAGKTTLVKLLARLYEPAAGRITVGGVDLADVDPVVWRRQLAAVFQDFARFELSAADNVGFGWPAERHDRAAVRAAAERVGAASFVEALPNGWDTVLSGEFTGGVDLSGGQWQRIALARAIFAVEHGAGILVLDEPTANLDVRAERELFERSLELTTGITTVLISHRFSTVRHADLICVLSDGRIAEQGTHDELMAAGGRYAEMFDMQASRFVAQIQGEG
jgi:ATP-binding cassette subfamily B protein